MIQQTLIKCVLVDRCKSSWTLNNFTRYTLKYEVLPATLDTKKNKDESIHQHYTTLQKFHLSIVCVHTAPQHHYHGNKSMDGSRYCSPEEIAQFQHTPDHSERLDHFQHQNYRY